MPAFPEESKRNKTAGVAVAFLHIDDKSHVEKVEILEAPDSFIDSFIKDAVINAVKQWAFKPTHFRGEPIKVQGKLTFYYVINNKEARVENPKSFDASQDK